jgi:hypothetical protein
LGYDVYVTIILSYKEGEPMDSNSNQDSDKRGVKQEKRLIVLCACVAIIMLLSLTRHLFS